MYRSLDGINWTPFSIPIDTNFITRCVAPLNDQYVGINTNGYVTYSTDGEIFADFLYSDGFGHRLPSIDKNYAFEPLDIKSINNRVYAYNYSNSIYVGTAIDQWTRYDANGYDYSWFNDIAVMNNEIYVVGSKGVFTIEGDNLVATVNEYLTEDEYVSVLNYKDKLLFIRYDGQVVSTSDGISFEYIFKAEPSWIKTLNAFIADNMLVASKDDKTLYYLTLD